MKQTLSSVLRTHQASSSLPKYHRRRGTSIDIRAVLHPLIAYNTHARCMAQSDDATLVVSLHLQHPDAIVQLCSDCVRVYDSPIS